MPSFSTDGPENPSTIPETRRQPFALKNDLLFQPENAVVVAVHDIERPGGMYENAVRLVHGRREGRPAGAGVAFFPGPGDKRDFVFLRRVLQDAVVAGVGDDDVVFSIDAQVL